MKKLVIFGAGDQGRLNYEIAQITGVEVLAFVDEVKTERIFGVPLFLSVESAKAILKPYDEVYFSVAIGNPYSKERMGKHLELKEAGFKPLTLIHPRASVSRLAKIGDGCSIMANCHIGPWAELGESVIVNANASVDHDCVLEDGVEIAPGATLAGRVRVKKYAWVCSGATIGPRVEIGENTIIGAGSVVLKDTPDNVRAWGVPARIK